MPNPIAFTLFDFDVRWYGVLIATGMLLAVIIVYRRAPSHGINSDDILDTLLWSIPIGVIGARLYYVAFEWNNYAGNFYDIINIRGGGLAIHGGLIFGIITAYLVLKKKKINFWNGLDLVAPAIALAQSIGRWGNYFNGEAHGGPTNLPWAIMVNGETVHPTFLYESLWCLMLFFLLSYLDKRRKFNGQIILLYVILYSVERFFVEWLRTDSLMVGPFKQAQMISVCAILISLFLYHKFKTKNRITIQ